MKIKFYFLTFFTFFTFALPTHAFEISPVKSLLTVDPGSSQTIFVKIRNSEKNDLTVKLNVLGMRQDENGRPVFERNVDIAESWVYPENNLVIIKSGETKSENFIIKIPNDAVAGSYYLGLSVDPVLEKNNKNSLAARLVSLLTLEVKGMVRESLNIEQWKLKDSSGGLFLSSENGAEKKWKFDLSFKNSGTIEVLAQAAVAVKTLGGQEIFSEPITLGNKLLAGSKRVLHPEITLQDRIILPGLYSVQIKINYGRTNQTVSATAYVWYFPIWSKIILGIAVIFILLLTLFLIKRPKRINFSDSQDR